MIAKNITYIDFNGNERTDECLFHFSDSEIMEMELSTSGGLANMLTRIIQAQDAPAIMENFKKIILKAYGEKSPDGKRFEKSEAISLAFSQTGAYDKLFMELVTDSKKAADFINAVIPSNNKTKSQPAPTVVSPAVN